MRKNAFLVAEASHSKLPTEVFAKALDDAEPRVRLAALRASETDRRNLRSAYMAMARAVAGKGDYVKADLAFHTTILSACGNQFVRQMHDAMGALLRVSFEVITQKPGGPADSLPLHEAVCIAIEQGDADAAERATLRLIDGAEEDLRDLIPRRTLPARDPEPVA